MKKLIIISLIISFSISFSIFLIFQQENWQTLNTNIEYFYSQNSLVNEPKILLVGSSEIGMLNASHVQLIVNEKFYDYTVYNLAISSDKPSKRIHELEKINSLNPKLIVYGVGFRDFSNEQLPTNLLPNPKNLMNDFLSENSPDFLENPKLVTLNVIKNSLDYTNTPENLEKNTPFFPYLIEYNQITKLEKLEQQPNSGLEINISDLEKNREFLALKEILFTFSEKKIPTILLLTPHNSYYLNSLSENNKQNFSIIINEINLNNYTQVYSLMQNYSNYNIWFSENHITHHSDGIQYSDDLGKIIIHVLEK